MSKFLSPGVIAGVLSFAAVLSSLLGKPALSAFLSDPTTAAHVTTAAGAIGAIVAGALSGVKSS